MTDDETEKRPPNPRHKPCPICGGTDFTWGKTVDSHPAGGVFFRAEGGIWGEGKQVTARECNHCGNVQLFTRKA